MEAVCLIFVSSVPPLITYSINAYGSNEPIMDRWKLWQVLLVPHPEPLLAQSPSPQLSHVLAVKCSHPSSITQQMHPTELPVG